MERERLIEQIKVHSDIYANADLKVFTDTQLLDIKNSLFIEIKVKLQSQTKN